MPFKSKRQQRAAFGGHIPGISKEKAKEWAKETPSFADLPERAPGEKGKPTLLSKESQLAHGSDRGAGLDGKAIRRGQKVEMEHTKNPATARQIAIDHLRERPDYYTRLAKAEKQASIPRASVHDPIPLDPDWEHSRLGPFVHERLHQAAEAAGIPIHVKQDLNDGAEAFYSPLHNRNGPLPHGLHYEGGRAYSDPVVIAHEMGHAVDNFKNPRMSRALGLANRIANPFFAALPGLMTGQDSSWKREILTPLATVGLGTVPIALTEGLAWHYGKGLLRRAGGNRIYSGDYHDVNRRNLLGQSKDKALGLALGYAGGRAFRAASDYIERRRAAAAQPESAAEQVKTAVVADALRTRIVEGLARKGVSLDGKEQAEVAKKAIRYARLLGDHPHIKHAPPEAAVARKELIDTINKFKTKAPNTGRSGRRGGYSANDGGGGGGGYGGGRDGGGFSVSPTALTGLLLTRAAAGVGAQYLENRQEDERKALEKQLRQARRGLEVGEVTDTTADRAFHLPLRTALRGTEGAITGAAAGAILGPQFAAFKNPYTPVLIGAGIGGLGKGFIDYSNNKAEEKAQAKLRDKIRASQTTGLKEAALSPTAVTALRHGGIGAAVGGLAGAAGGAVSTEPGHRGSGALKGALTGAGVGAGVGAGASLLHGRPPSAAAAPHMRAPAPQTPPAPLGKQIPSAPVGKQPLHSANTVMATPPPSTRPYGPLPGANFPARSSPFKVTDPSELYHLEQQGWKAGPEDILYPPHMLKERSAAIAAKANAPPVKVSGLLASSKIASASPADLEARLNRMQAEQEHAARADRIVHGLDALGLGILAAPAAGELAAGVGKRLEGRGGLIGGVGSLLHHGGEAVHHRLGEGTGKAIGEVVGLGLMVPHLVHPIAHRLTHPKIAPAPSTLVPSVPEQPQAASDMRAMSSAAEKVGRLLARPAPQEKVSGLGSWAWKNKKTLAGVGAVGAVGAGLYGAKKGIDTVGHMATEQHAPSRAVGVPPGMRPPAPDYMPIGSQ